MRLGARPTVWYVVAQTLVCIVSGCIQCACSGRARSGLRVVFWRVFCLFFFPFVAACFHIEAVETESQHPELENLCPAVRNTQKPNFQTRLLDIVKEERAIWGFFLQRMQTQPSTEERGDPFPPLSEAWDQIPPFFELCSQRVRGADRRKDFYAYLFCHFEHNWM